MSINYINNYINTSQPAEIRSIDSFADASAQYMEDRSENRVLSVILQFLDEKLPEFEDLAKDLKKRRERKTREGLPLSSSAAEGGGPPDDAGTGKKGRPKSASDISFSHPLYVSKEAKEVMFRNRNKSKHKLYNELRLKKFQKFVDRQLRS